MAEPGRVTAELLDLHADLKAEAPWTPHISLALNVPEHRRTAALSLLAGLPAVTGQFVAARSYDTEARTVTHLPVGRH